MVDVDGYLPLISPVVAALASGTFAERLPPRTASWLLTVLAMGPALCSMGALLALADDGPVFAALFGLGLAGAGHTAFRQVRALRVTARELRERPAR